MIPGSDGGDFALDDDEEQRAGSWDRGPRPAAPPIGDGSVRAVYR